MALVTVAGLAALAMQTAIPWQTPSAALEARHGPVLARFASASAFRRYVESLRNRRSRSGDLATYDDAEEPAPTDMAMAPPAIEAAPAAQMEPGSNPAITNNQTIGVDEGGIVKQIGRFLVVLQDGRLFSADLGEGASARLRLADRTDLSKTQALIAGTITP